LAHKGELHDITNAYNAEDRINNLRTYLRDSEIESIDGGEKNYQTSVYYIDIVNSLESMGDFIINISQDLEKYFVTK
jgi:Na+/phosphate symporter